MFVLLFMFSLVWNSEGFRINEEEIIAARSAAQQHFHIETQVRFCGCEEKSALEDLKLLKWTPEDFMTHHGKLWLGGVEAQNPSNCSKMCQLVNKRTTHFTYENVTSLCQCFSDLHPFHCEEEEGVDLVQIQCIDHLKVPNKRPILRMLSRQASQEPKTESGEKITSRRNFELASTTKGTTLAAASIVLILSALCLLLCLIGKTYHENHKRKIAEEKEISRKSSQISTDTVITRL